MVGLEIGAGDYVSKPFGVRGAIARIRAVVRQVRPGEPNGAGGRPVPTPDHYGPG